MKNTGKKGKEDLAKVGSLLTAERSVWSTRVDVVEVLPNGEQKLTTRPGWGCEGVTHREIDGTIRLVTTGIPRPTAPPIPDGPRLLLDMVSLVKPPIPWERVDEAVSAEDACTWCRDYGLPAVESFNRPDGYRAQLSLSLFQREVLTLRLLWDVSMALIDPYPDKATLARDLSQLWKARANQRREATDAWRQMLLKEAASMARRPLRELEELARLGVADLFNERLERVPLTFAWGDSTPRFRREAGSLFDIAYVQLANQLTNPDGESMRHIKVCKNENCRDIFWWPHGNQEYCPRPQCDRRAVHRRKKRSERKAQSAQCKQAKSL